MREMSSLNNQISRIKHKNLIKNRKHEKGRNLNTLNLTTYIKENRPRRPSQWLPKAADCELHIGSRTLNSICFAQVSSLIIYKHNATVFLLNYVPVKKIIYDAEDNRQSIFTYNLIVVYSSILGNVCNVFK